MRHALLASGFNFALLYCSTAMAESPAVVAADCRNVSMKKLFIRWNVLMMQVYKTVVVPFLLKHSNLRAYLNARPATLRFLRSFPSTSEAAN